MFHFYYPPLICFQDEDEEDNPCASDNRRQSWDDDFILKRQFSALVPAFDPRPGRTNVNQTQDFEVPAPGASESMDTSQSDCEHTEPRLCLSIRGPSFPGVSRPTNNVLRLHQ